MEKDIDIYEIPVHLSFDWVLMAPSMDIKKFARVVKDLVKLEDFQQEIVIDYLISTFIHCIMMIDGFDDLIDFKRYLNVVNVSKISKDTLDSQIFCKVVELLAGLPNKYEVFVSPFEFKRVLEYLEILGKFGYDINNDSEIFVLGFLKFIEKTDWDKNEIFEVLDSIMILPMSNNTRVNVIHKLSKFKYFHELDQINQNNIISQISFDSITIAKSLINKNNKQVLSLKFSTSNIKNDCLILSKEKELLEKLEKINKQYTCFPEIYNIQFIDNNLIVMQEYLPKSLTDLIGLKVETDFIVSALSYIVKSYLHALNTGVVHGSLTPEHICFNDFEEIDRSFPICKINYSSANISRMTFSINRYSAPELKAKKQLLLNKDQEKADAYSVGIILLQLLTQYKPENENNTKDILSHIKMIKNPIFLKQILLGMLKTDPEERFDFVSIQSFIPGGPTDIID